MSGQAYVMEIFSAIQGEGPWIGIHQIFFRLYRCNLRCAWCDTPESFDLTGPGKVEEPPGSRRFKTFENPLSPAQAMSMLRPFIALPHHSVSFTGGEPLLHKDFLSALFPLLKNEGEKIFLETGGTLPDLLAPLIEHVDFISMDIKLPSSTKERPLWEKHEAFLRIASRKETCVKIVLTQDTREDEIFDALRLVNRINSSIPVILQPVTPRGDRIPPSEPQILRWHSQSLQHLSNVRVIPQVHKLFGQK